MTAELVVDVKGAPGDTSAGSGTAMAPIVVPVFAAGLLAKFVSPASGLVALAVGAVTAMALRRPPKGPFVLRVERATLVVARQRGVERTEVPLLDVLDVTLDRSKQGQRERMRIALERRDAEPIHVPEEPTTPIEAQEWLAKIRLFLRSAGWVPVDER